MRHAQQMQNRPRPYPYEAFVSTASCYRWRRAGVRQRRSRNICCEAEAERACCLGRGACALASRYACSREEACVGALQLRSRAQSHSGLTGYATRFQGGAVTREELGRCTWTLLHTLAAQYAEQPTKQQQRDARELVRAARACTGPHSHLA